MPTHLYENGTDIRIIQVLLGHSRHVDVVDVNRFIEAAENELIGLHEGNFARYTIRPREFAAWRKVWERKEAAARKT